MAKVSVECPGCFAKLNLADRSKLGKKIKCPKCAEVFVAEAPDDDDDDTELLDDDDDIPARSSGSRRRPAARGGKKSGKKGGSGGGNNGLLIGGGIAALLVVVVAGLFLAGVFSGKEPPPAVVAEAPAPVVAAPKIEISPAEKMLALRWMPADTELILHVKVADIWQAPLLKGLVDNPQTAKPVQDMQKYIGVGPADIESVTLGVSDLKGIQSASMMAAMGMPPAANQFKGLVVARSKKPLSQSAILQASPELKSVEYNGKSYFLLPTPPAPPAPPGQPGQPAVEVGAWVADANTVVMGGVNELKSAMDKGETVTPRKELSFVDATPHVVLVVAPKDPQAMSPSQTPPSLPGAPPQIAEMQQALNESMRGFGLGINIRGGFDLQTSLLMKDSAGAAKVKAGLEAAVVEGRKQFDVVKATAPPLLGDLGQMLIDNLKINEQSQVVKVTTNIPDSAQQQLEQLPPLLMVMAMTGGLNPLAGGPPPGGLTPGGPGDGTSKLPVGVAESNQSPASNGEPRKMNEPEKGVGESNAVVPVKAESLPSNGQLTVKTAWNWSKEEDKQLGSVFPIWIKLDMKADGLENICAFGELSMKTITTDTDESLKIMERNVIKDDSARYSKPTKGMLPYDFVGRTLEGQPLDAMRVEFAVASTGKPAMQFKVLEGEFKYYTSEDSQEFTINDVAKTALRPLADPALKSAGVKLLLTKKMPGEPEKVVLTCGKGHFLGLAYGSYERDLTDRERNLLGNRDRVFTVPFETVVEGSRIVQRYRGEVHIDQKATFLPIPPNTQVKFKLHRDVKEHIVSFRFENVPMPSPDAQPKK